MTDAFHATSDKQSVRNQVFHLIESFDVRIDVTIFEKRKTAPARQGIAEFYDLAWFLHMKHVLPRVSNPTDEIMVVSASLATRREQQTLGEALKSTARRLAGSRVVLSTYWPAGTDPCLQIADYCCWAIQRKWERNDTRSFELIQAKIASEFEAFKLGTEIYYGDLLLKAKGLATRATLGRAPRTLVTSLS